MQTDNALFANREPPTVCKQTEHRTRSLVPAFTRCIHGRRGRPLRRHRRETQTQLLTPWQRRRNADKQAFPIREYETRSRSREHVSFGEQRMPLACHGSWDSSAPPPAATCPRLRLSVCKQTFFGARAQTGLETGTLTNRSEHDRRGVCLFANRHFSVCKQER